jgi:hypothetical protein
VGRWIDRTLLEVPIFTSMLIKQISVASVGKVTGNRLDSQDTKSALVR